MSSIVRKDLRVLEQLIQGNETRMDALGRAAAQAIVDDMKLLMQQSTPTGRTYTRGSIQHTASAPGQPPAIDTAALINSLDWYREGRLRYIIHDGVEYGYILETGGANTAPRPFVNPVIDQWRRRKLVELARDMYENLR